MQVLQRRAQIEQAREEMRARGISAMTPATPSLLRRAMGRVTSRRHVPLGDQIKSWDVLATVRFCEETLAKNDPILDIGAYASEVLVSLHRAGFTDLTGVDLNPRLRDMPHRDRIRYVTADFMNTPFPDASFAAVTSISVIEHGYDPQRLFQEMARILRPGGHFIASTDYWPEKIDTGDTRFFDMSWLIFSREDVAELIEEAARHGLEPAGELRFDGGDKAVEHGGYEYTFAWLALRKKA